MYSYERLGNSNDFLDFEIFVTITTTSCIRERQSGGPMAAFYWLKSSYGKYRAG